MAQVIEQKDVAQFVADTIANSMKGCQMAQRQAGLPAVAVEDLVFDAYVVKDGGLNAVPRTQVSTRQGEEVQETEVPEVRQTTTSTRKAEDKNKGAQTDKATETGEQRRTTSDESTETGSDLATEEQISTTNQESKETKDDGTVETVTEDFVN